MRNEGYLEILFYNPSYSTFLLLEFCREKVYIEVTLLNRHAQ